MIELSDYNNPFDAITNFENKLAEYTGSPYAVATDCCTHAMELCLRYLKPSETITIPYRTYLSVPMLMHKLQLDYKIEEYEWEGRYQLGNTSVWDSARMLEVDMYLPNQFQCLSFGRTKPLEIGRGGAILTDNKGAYDWFKKASYDGRDLNIHPWQDQNEFQIGYHYMMRPEECIDGMNKMGTINNEYSHTYPDIRKTKIIG
jgi:dTDP-4-amino-4,6-dideoxygalactose transaminase